MKGLDVSAFKQRWAALVGQVLEQGESDDDQGGLGDGWQRAAALHSLGLRMAKDHALLVGRGYFGLGLGGLCVAGYSGF